MYTAFLSLTLLSITGVDGGKLATRLEVKPTSISLHAPPGVSSQRSCLLRRKDAGELKVLSATPSDPAIGLTWRENPEHGTVVVTATLPAGYRVPEGKQAEIIVVTDFKECPEVRIPVRVWTGPNPTDPGWLRDAQALIGKPAPVVVVSRIQAGTIPTTQPASITLPTTQPASPKAGEMPTPQASNPRASSLAQPSPQFSVLSSQLSTPSLNDALLIGVPSGKITVLIFAAHWCGHCDVNMPILERVSLDYIWRDVDFISIHANAGNGQGISEAIERWGLTWTLGLDRDFSALHTYGVKAFPVVFVIGRDGTVEAVHGRNTNTPIHNGLDNLETELRTELDLMLAGLTHTQFPATQPSPTTQPAFGLLPVTRAGPNGRNPYASQGSQARPDHAEAP